jgi:hypothetical protein
MANTDDVPYQPVWVTFDPVACGVILRHEIETQIDEKVWQMFGINQGFKEDKWPSVIDGEVRLPTFDWLGMINGRRRSDDTCFYSKVRITKEEDIEDGKINLPILMHIIGNSIAWFNSFSDCACKVGQPCDYHARLEFTGEPVEAGESDV